MLDERYVQEIVASVVKSMATTNGKKLKGVFPTMTEALAAVDKAYKELKSYTVEQREKMISKILPFLRFNVLPKYLRMT